jgi:hypothetical protein
VALLPLSGEGEETYPVESLRKSKLQFLGNPCQYNYTYINESRLCRTEITGKYAIKIVINDAQT